MIAKIAKRDHIEEKPHTNSIQGPFAASLIKGIEDKQKKKKIRRIIRGKRRNQWVFKEKRKRLRKSHKKVFIGQLPL